MDDRLKFQALTREDAVSRMAKLRESIVGMRQVASRIGAACSLCALLVLGLLWPVPVSFAAEKDAAASEAAADAAAPKAPVDDVGNVMVEAPSEAPAPSGPQLQPESEPIAPDTPIVPEYERAWPIGADDASAVLAELWPDGTFVVDGAGKTVAFDKVEDVPWLAAGEAGDIKRVIFADKVEATSLAHWFEGCSNLSEIANAPAEEAPAPEPPAEPESEPALAPQEEAQVNITVPSSVSMVLNAEGDNTALIPVAAANRSERNVAIVGVRLKRADQDLPGGSWSLTTESGSTTFVQDARFTPLGLEATFDRPVLLAAGDENTMLVWHGTFTDYGMKTLLNATIDADGNSFAYGSMIWIVAAA